MELSHQLSSLLEGLGPVAPAFLHPHPLDNLQNCFNDMERERALCNLLEQALMILGIMGVKLV